METTRGFGFVKDEETSALGRKATVFKQAKDWDGAINTLREMQERMWVSPVHYGVNEWCRLALVLQQAGRFDESEREFEKLLDEIHRMARKFSFMDDPTSLLKQQAKQEIYDQVTTIYPEIIKERRELSRTREARIAARLKKVDSSAK